MKELFDVGYSGWQVFTIAIIGMLMTMITVLWLCGKFDGEPDRWNVKCMYHNNLLRAESNVSSLSGWHMSWRSNTAKQPTIKIFSNGCVAEEVK